MPLLDYNYNYNYNYNSLGGSGRSGDATRVRFDTDVYSRLVNTTPGNFVVPPPGSTGYPRFPGFWDPDLQAAMFLDDFLANTANWRVNYRAVATNGRTLPQNMTQGELNDQARFILQAGLEREDRFTEIIDQDDGEGAMSYFIGMLRIDPGSNPATNLLMRVGRKVGEHVVMCLKGDFRSPRPPQLCPAIEPMIDPPRTPSFPAGHALQSYLIAYLLGYSLPRLPQQTLPPLPHAVPPPPPPPVLTPPAGLGPFPLGTPGLSTGLLFDLADRISFNRVVAGIHYQIDIDAGEAVAIACFLNLIQRPMIVALQAAVATEFPQYA